MVGCSFYSIGYIDCNTNSVPRIPSALLLCWQQWLYSVRIACVLNTGNFSSLFCLPGIYYNTPGIVYFIVCLYTFFISKFELFKLQYKYNVTNTYTTLFHMFSMRLCSFVLLCSIKKKNSNMRINLMYFKLQLGLNIFKWNVFRHKKDCNSISQLNRTKLNTIIPFHCQRWSVEDK